MKKLLIIFAFSALFVAASISAGAHTPQDGAAEDNHTAQEEAEGKTVWEKLQAKALNCKDLSDDNFETLGEYFMGQMTGGSHAAMNTMMIQMMGEQGEEQIHAVMGKRLSGCDTLAAFPSRGVGFTPTPNPLVWGFMPMMRMMMNGGMMGGGGNSMMNFGLFGFFGWIFMVLWWVLIIAAIVALVKWLANQFRGAGPAGKSALDILKERYVKGEISKEEFESKKKDVLS